MTTNPFSCACKRAHLSFTEPIILQAEENLQQEAIVSAMRFKSSSPDPWTKPRAHNDASLRFMKHGKLQPMEQKSRSILALFGWR